MSPVKHVENSSAIIITSNFAGHSAARASLVTPMTDDDSARP